ncbi:hypothetical protein YQE_07176, partial [Dendroctonus ponderosae]
MMEFSQPPPNLSMPPPNLAAPPPGVGIPMQHNMGYNHNRQPFRPFMKPLPGPLGNMTLEDFDGKRLRKSVMRKTVDYNSSVIKELETRIWQRDYRDRRAMQPDAMYYPDLMPPPSYPDNPINCVTTRFVKTATNKMRCPIFCMAWTPEGRRLVTGASSGEFTLWNGLTFNFETILQAHDSPVRTMVWSHNDSWMVTGDHAGFVKYWQSNMNNVKVFQAHKEALRGISFSPSDNKFVTCSDDGTLRIWDFFRYQEERVLRGHGADVKCVHWHPQKSLIISGSKDNQQPIKLWDPKSGQSLATLHAHKSTVMDLKWNANGNWLITASRDHLLKLFDLRNLSQEVQTFRGHKKEASSVAWHPIHEGLFASGGSDGAIVFWHVGADKEVGAIEQAHDSIVWTLAWHPLGHILCSGSNDHTSKFWTRNRPGDQMRDKYNLNTQPNGIAGLEDMDLGEDKVEITALIGDENTAIPGLDLDSGLLVNEERAKPKKVPFSKPIPRNFQAQWNEATSVAGSKLEKAISEGPEVLQRYIDSGAIEELQDVIPIRDPDEDDYLRDTNHDEIENMHNMNRSSNDMDNHSQYNDEDFRGMDHDIRGFNATGESDIRPFGGDTDFRSHSDMDFRSNHDFDHRKPLPFRSGPIRPMSGRPITYGVNEMDGPVGLDSPMGGRLPPFGPSPPMGPGRSMGGATGPDGRRGLLGPPLRGPRSGFDSFGDEDFRPNSRSLEFIEPFDRDDEYDDSNYEDDYNNEFYDEEPSNNSNNWQRNGGNFQSVGFNQRSGGSSSNENWNNAPSQNFRPHGGRGARGGGGGGGGNSGKSRKSRKSGISGRGRSARITSAGRRRTPRGGRGRGVVIVGFKWAANR